ncbi:tRNA (5-methylaminomethyl-2-thiouridine)(34)-methyltransferase MnmD [Pseudanabaena sp. PCC 6802]|uniref:tRNA (5-methylaminomethyl-2-thiouridine)(34)-methyltransferase MnmD n=1 Tax=Pseudanabaena sp. PCC 6802 TaxID=118173 RepID=UPI00034925AF|nr:MnmC family methyltransferase [Pseudanabaena sp. PCC 6802]
MDSDLQDRLTLLATADGSTTFFSDVFGEAFHSIHGAKQEAEAKFVLPARIRAKAERKGCVNIIDVCYGLGYNSAAAIACIDELGSGKPQLQIVALENNWQVPKAAIASGLLDIWPQTLVQHLKVLAETKGVKTANLNLSLLIGDARQTMQDLPKTWADAIFLDPFSPPRCPQLWTMEFISLLASCLKPDGYLVTYSCAAAVRSAMLAAGLEISSSSPVGRKAPGTVAAFSNNDLPPLTEAEKEILQTRAAIPYRDPHLSDPAAAIIQRRQLEQNLSGLESTSAWKRRQRA